MPHIAGHDRSQTLLLPELLDDYVDPENPVRFIEAEVSMVSNQPRIGDLDRAAIRFLLSRVSFDVIHALF